MRKVKEKQLPYIVGNEVGGVWTSEGGIVYCTVKQGDREARIGGDPEAIADIDLRSGEVVYGRIKRIESRNPILWDDIEAFRINKNLWRMDVFSDDIKDEDELIEE